MPKPLLVLDDYMLVDRGSPYGHVLTDFRDHYHLDRYAVVADEEPVDVRPVRRTLAEAFGPYARLSVPHEAPTGTLAHAVVAALACGALAFVVSYVAMWLRTRGAA